jgi:hypothetical protein
VGESQTGTPRLASVWVPDPEAKAAQESRDVIHLAAYHQTEK